MESSELWKIVTPITVTVIGTLNAIGIFHPRKNKLRNTLKTDLEILQYLKESDPMHGIVRRNVVNLIEKIYSKEELPDNATSASKVVDKEEYFKVGIILNGILVALLFAYAIIEYAKNNSWTDNMGLPLFLGIIFFGVEVYVLARVFQKKAILV